HGFAANPASPGAIYVLTDGGIYRSTNRGAADSWAFVGDGIANVELYDIADAPTQPDLVIGGTQANETNKYDGRSTVCQHTRGGDGATVDVDPTNAQILYAMYQYSDSLARSTDGGGSFGPFAQNLPPAPNCFNFFWQVHPTTPSTQLAACNGSLWRNTAGPPAN